MESDITDEDKEIALYGMKRLTMLVTSIGVALLIGIAVGELKGVILFLAMFMPLRVFAGGLHMPRLWLCGIASSLLIISVALLIKYIEPEKMIASELLILCIISAVLVLAEIAVIFLPSVSPRVSMIAGISLMAENSYLIIQALINTAFEKYKTNGKCLSDGG